ncbi:hypothetical protein BH10BDE1_BH10BDE1_32100 [soil metagenome]
MQLGSLDQPLMILQRILRAVAIMAIAMAAALAAQSAQASVWEINSDWTVAKEDQFGSWLEQMTNQPVSEDGKIQSRLFEAGQPLYKLPVDCADFVYAARIIFASQNGLPFASKVTFKGKLLDASRSSWDSTPKDQRLHAFLSDIVEGLGTWSLLRDTTPITELSREHVKAGTILLAAQSVGHSWLVRKVRATGIPELVFASVPAREELFYRDGLPRGEAVYDKLPGGSDQAGFRSFCIPGKSCPQATGAPKLAWKRHQDWRPMIFRMLQIRPEPLIESIGREIGNLCREAKGRVSLTYEAAAFKQKKNSCLVKGDYYNYSTNNRDSRFKEGFIDLWELWMTTNDLMDEARISGRGLPRNLTNVLDRIQQVFSDGIIDERAEDIVCPVKIDAQTTLALRDIRQSSIAGRLSPDPNETVRARWGLEPERGECLPGRSPNR